MDVTETARNSQYDEKLIQRHVSKNRKREKNVALAGSCPHNGTIRNQPATIYNHARVVCLQSSMFGIVNHHQLKHQCHRKSVSNF
jgi:hypothetical protein